MQDGYFFSITGTLGVLGRLYGSVDFAIIKADLNLEIKIYVRVTFASYEPIPITARASVDVSLSVMINLGLFKITFHLSFKCHVEATFVLENPMKPPAPWGEEKEVDSYRALYCRRINKAMALSADGLLAAIKLSPKWENLQKGSTIQLNGWAAPALTVAGDYAASPKEQQVCYVTCFILPTPEPIQVAPSGIEAVGCNGSSGAMIVMPGEVAHAALVRARSQLAKAALNEMEPALFEDFAIRVLEWVIAAGRTSLTPEELDKQVVSDDFLGSVLNYLSGETTPTPIPIPAIESFLDLHTEFVFSLCSENRAENGVFFPAPPGITLEVPDFGEWKGYRYSFGEYNSSSSTYLNALNDYFNQLKIQVEKEQKQQRYHQTCATSAYDGPSIASYILGDYFAMIGRLAIQAMRDGIIATTSW